jgi:2-iminobutanoate/2-iminopropanoate deaminase
MVLKIERFQPEGMNVRMSGGKPSYSHVVTVSGSGKIVYTAGQLARDVDGYCVGKGDMRAQMEQTFQNLDRCLGRRHLADVVKTNTFVTDFDEFQKCADIRMRYLGVATPTSTTITIGLCSWVWRRRCRYDRSAGPRTGHYSEIIGTTSKRACG